MTGPRFQRFEFDATISDRARLAVCDWLRQHGIDPKDVPRECWIELRPDERQVRHLAFKLDEQGNRRVNLDAEGRYLDPVTEERTVQLESAPMPFPVEGWAGAFGWSGRAS